MEAICSARVAETICPFLSDRLYVSSRERELFKGDEMLLGFQSKTLVLFNQ